MDLVIANSKKQAVTTSRILADKFNKRHGNVLAKIEQLKIEDKETFNALKIKSVKYIDEKGELRPEFILDRDAYAFFAMGFTGKQANKFKIDFIRAFNDMERWIKDRLQSSIEYKVMQAILKDSRKLIGKETKSHHYSNEAKLVNWALRGEFKGVDRETLTLDEINLLNELQTRNAVLIGAGMTREQRKESLHLMVELGRSDLLECA